MKATSWTITHDPMQLWDAKTDSTQFELEAREQGEDILQATRGNRTLDLGWYYDRYKVLLIEGDDWAAPVRQAEARDLQAALAAFRHLLL